MAAEVAVVWSQRDCSWFAKGLSRPEWVRVHGHLGAEATELELLEAVRKMFMPQDMRGTHLRTLPPAWRLPSDP